MKVIQINTTCGIGSTGKIAVSISELLNANGIENEVLYSVSSNGYKQSVQCGENKNQKINALKSRILGNYGFNSEAETRKIIEELKRFSPDAILLHNIHGHDCNIEMLFDYFRKEKVKLFWTFHDCWAFTGYCTHFTVVKCEKWKTECNNCLQKKEYSWFFDNSRQLFNRKREAMKGLDLTIIAPSQWLADLVKQSFLKEYPVSVIHNGIDLSVFRPTESKFREKYNIGADKFILLGVAFDWGRRKGLDVFLELAKRLDAGKFQIVLVGTDDAADTQLPVGIISIHRTQNQQELAEIYTAADMLLNPTREDNYPTVNMEAIACGTPVVTFRTGGSPEILDEFSGSIVDCDDMDAMETEILRIARDRPYTKEDCLNRAKCFDQDRRFQEYMKLIAGNKNENSICF